MELLPILLFTALFVWWLVMERSRNRRERELSSELVRRLIHLNERVERLEAQARNRSETPARIGEILPPTGLAGVPFSSFEPECNADPDRNPRSGRHWREAKTGQIPAAFAVRGAEDDASDGWRPLPLIVEERPASNPGGVRQAADELHAANGVNRLGLAVLLAGAGYLLAHLRSSAGERRMN